MPKKYQNPNDKLNKVPAIAPFELTNGRKMPRMKRPIIGQPVILKIINSFRLNVSI